MLHVCAVYLPWGSLLSGEPRCLVLLLTVRCSSAFVSCRCQSSAGRSSSSSLPDVATSASKYDRIIAFVEAHATPVVADGSPSSNVFQAEAELPSSWHNSYDEEAEEGELLDEPHLVLSAASTALSASSAFAASAMPAAAATVLVNSWSYGSAENPKPWCYSWDEEAEGDFELADCAQLTPAQAREQRRAAMHEARHAARADRKMRRAQLHPQLGDLEHMTAWVGQQQPQQQKHTAQRVPSSLQYQQLLALVAGDAGRQYRKPKQWHLTFDEDVHGDAPDAVLGSC
ncbi:hypothetical protein COO60DRAFT_456890 [Scenedesmus sp. NREL 46B-D3]|nr:hypothetical protein COO60DRAFT_456890 [Scenedesmus sp. NREL 46B-D3]